MGPLERDICELIDHGLAATNQQVYAWLNVQCTVSRATVKTLLSKLTRRGRITRVRAGYYRTAKTQEAIRLLEVAEQMASLGPYSPDECAAIVKAIVTCQPVSEITSLLVCSHQDIAA